MISDAIKRALDKKDKRGWDEWNKLYIMVDLHDVIIIGNYTKYNDNKIFHHMAIPTLQKMTKNDKICLILWTSSYDDAIKNICDNSFAPLGINFDYINENPECKSTEILNVDQKPYFDLLFDDKAGFNGNEDWEVVNDCFSDYF